MLPECAYLSVGAIRGASRRRSSVAHEFCCVRSRDRHPRRGRGPEARAHHRVAAELFYERGYENTSLDAIAEGMNVTKPFIYAHFTSKAELFAEICSRGIASALAALDGVLLRRRSPARAA